MVHSIQQPHEIPTQSHKLLSSLRVYYLLWEFYGEKLIDFFLQSDCVAVDLLVTDHCAPVKRLELDYNVKLYIFLSHTR